MAKVFITGIAGFLGSHLAEALQGQGHTIWGIDSLIGGDMENVPRHVVCRVTDCNERDYLQQIMNGAEIVYHCAATAHEGLSVFSPHLIGQNVFGASVATFSAAIAAGVKRIVFCSSMARYGAGPPPFGEHLSPRPVDPYGIAKVAAEQVLRTLCEVHGTEYVIAVPHNIIGPRQKYDDPFRNVASIMINLMLQGRHPMIYGDGSQVRCFSYIDDCLSCLVKMGFEPGLSGHTINIGPDEGAIQIKDLFGLIASITGFEGPPMFMPGRPQEVHHAVCSSDKARELLGYQTTVSLQTGLERMVAYIRAKGPKPFQYHLPIEIETAKTPRTWTDQLY